MCIRDRHIAALNGKLNVVKTFLGYFSRNIWNKLWSLLDRDNRKKVYVNLEDRSGQTALHLASEKVGNVDVVRNLIANNADVNASNSYNRLTPLSCACRFGDIDVVKTIINAPNINKENISNFLHDAVRKEDPEGIIDFLIVQRANINAKDSNGNSPLHIAVAKRRPDKIINFIIEKGAEIDARNNHGYTPLHFAVEYQYIDVVNFLIEKKANPNIENKDGLTILHFAFFIRNDDRLKEHLPDIWMGEIEPYLEEFFYDQPGKVEPFRWGNLIENKLKEWV